MKKWFTSCAGGTALLLVLVAAGLFLATPATASPTVNFSFDQVDIRLLVKLVGDMTGRRFVIDDEVSGKVTVVTPEQIPIEEVYPLFLSILESSGYSVMQRGQTHHIVALPEQEIYNATVVTENSMDSPQGVITKVIRLQHVSALEVKKILQPMVRGAKNGALAAFGPTNHLLITDTAENIARIEEIIAELDKQGSSSVMEIIMLNHASAEDLAREVSTAMEGAMSSSSRFSRHVENVTGGAGALPAGITVVPVSHVNGLILVGAPVDLAEMKRIVLLMDVEAPSGYGRLNAIFLKYMDAEEAANSLNALLAKKVDKDVRQRIAIEASIANNALIVDAAPQEFELINDLVQQLDQVPQQVLVEILIAEITEGNNFDFGFEYQTTDNPEDGSYVPIGRTRLAEDDILMNALVDQVVPQGITFGLTYGTFVDAAGRVLPRVPVLMSAVAQDREINILSNVPLWAQNNREASVSIVENIPILRSTIEGGSGTARDVIQNIDRLDVGIKLKFTPHVNPKKEVLMELNPSIEAITDEGPDNTFAPTIARREVSTTVTVPDEATVVISGLIREDRVKDVSKIPLLGDIPIIGFLFRRESERKQRTNLLIFVTPHIVTDMEDAMAMKRDLEERTQITAAQDKPEE